MAGMIVCVCAGVLAACAQGSLGRIEHDTSYLSTYLFVYGLVVRLGAELFDLASY